MTAQTDPVASQRLRTALLMIVVVAAVLALRLGYWQILRGQEMFDRSAGQTRLEIVLSAKRGDIVTQDGVLLAKDIFKYNVLVNTKEVKEPDQLAADLAPKLELPRDRVLALLKSKEPRVALAMDVSTTVAQQITDYRIKKNLLNIEVEMHPARVYPNAQFFGPGLGFVFDLPRTPSGGIEQGMNSVLQGVDGKMVGRKNALSDFIPNMAFENHPAVDGAKVTLTIQSGMQRIVEQELEKAIRDSRATSGSIIVMDPKTGAILALAVWPSADLNYFSLPANQGKYGNQTVDAQYEPGSVFNLVTYAAALDAGVITPGTCFEDPGRIEVPGALVENANGVVGGHVCLVDALRQSLNVEAAKAVISLGAPRFYQYITAFGFGSPSRVELGGEVTGSVKRPGDGYWHDGEQAYNAYGQRLYVTPMQMIAAVAAVANGGKLMRPYIVKSVQRPGDPLPVETASETVRQVIKPETAKALNKLLMDSMMPESSNLALVPGYAVAGKTGTAEISVLGFYDPKQTIASFAGYLPADDPQLAILVKLDKPQSSMGGAPVASPVFAAVAKQLVIQAGIAPDAIRLANK